MYKSIKYIFLALGVGIVFTNCKGSRNSQRAEDTDQVKGNALSEKDELAFAAKYIDACTARMRGNVNEALKLFNECLKLNPSSVPVKYELATVNKLLGVNDVALAYAKECAAADPKNEWYQLILIECYRTLRQYANSVKVQENLIRSYPENSEFKENLAIEYTYIGQYEKAYNIYNELEKQYGVNEQLSINKIKLLQQENKYNDIEKEINKLLETAPESPRYLTYLAEHFEFIKQPEKAKSVYDKILKIDPDNATVHLALSDYYKQKGDDETAYNQLKLAFLNAELDVVTKYNIAQAYFNTFRKFPESNYGTQGFELVQIMLKVHPSSPEANALYGDFLYYRKKFDEANKYFYLSALKDKSNYLSWEKLMNCDNLINNFDSLQKHSFEAMELFPNQPMTYYYNGIANIQIHDYKKASESLRDGLEFVLDDKILMSNFYSHLGDAYYYLKDYEKSDRALDDALKINADNFYVLNNYAYYLSQRKEQLEKAEKLSKRSLELKPNEGNFMDTYGYVLFLEGKYIQAEEWLKKATELYPKKAGILERYADCLLKLNKVNEAIRYYELAIEAGGNKEKLTQKIKDKKLND
ncbi:MAG: tetratricopeptide repeat protein [Sphingobacteriaceae bacterium]